MSGAIADQILNPETTPAAAAPAHVDGSIANNILGNEPGVGQDYGLDQRLANYDTIQSQYGTPGQQALTAIEGAGQGFAGPLATGAEALLHAAGVPGLSPEEQELRAQANPAIHIGAEIGGFGLGALFGTGEAALLAKIGESAKTLHAVSKLSPLLKTGIKVGAETAALQAGNEISKVINQDPNQSLGSAAINIGLSGILGGAGGVALGTIPHLWNTVANKVKVAEFASDFMSELQTLQKPAAEAVAADIKAPAHLPEHMKDWFGKFKKDNPAAVSAFEKEIEEQAPKKMTAGRKAAQWVQEKGADYLAGKIGKAASGTVGGIAGAFSGHPIVGAWMGDKILSPAFAALAKPFAEIATNTEAMKGVLDYAAQVAKGQHQIDRVAKSFFQTAELLPKELLPTEKNREDLKKSLEHIQNQDNAINVGGNIGHYLPNHNVAAGTLAAESLKYFNSLKPSVTKASPLDIGSPVNKMKETQYNRALDIAQQPLMVLKHAKDGTLQSQDIKTLNTLYPGLHQAMVSKINESMVGHLATKNSIPYHERRMLSMFMGSPLDSAMTLGGAQSIIKSNAGQISSPENQQQPKQHKASGRELSQINKVNALYLTGSQQRQVSRRS